MRTSIKTLAALAVSALGLVGAAGSGTAQSADNWPNGAVQIVVPFGAGGDTDYNARVLAKYLEPILDTTFPVVNVTGAGGSIGARQVLGAKPDGQTVLFFHSAMLVNTASGIADFSYEDFEMVGIAGREPGSLIVVNNDAPWQTMEELVEATKADPFGIDLTTNTGATTYLVGALLRNAGAEFNFVDVGGSAARLTAVLGGNVDVSQNPLGQVKTYVESGELRALATVAGSRSEALPDVPTLKELGYDVDFQYDYFFLFPKGTPEEIVSKFTAAVEKVTQDPAYAEEIGSTYFQTPRYLAPAAALERLNEVAETVDTVQF